MKSSTSLLAIVSLFGLTQAVPVVEPEAFIAGHDTFIPQWEVEVTPGGKSVVLNGTIEEVHAQLLELNPSWDADYLTESESEVDAASLEKRTDFWDSKYLCGKFPLAKKTPVQDGIKYLRGVKGKPRNGAGPGNCGRVSCSHNSGIWWCNDDRSPKTLASFGSIADGAEMLVIRCSSCPSMMCLTGGQIFHHTNWNVIVRNDNC